MPKHGPEPVDLLIEGGVVITMDAERRIFNPGYVAVRGTRIVGVGCAGESRFEVKKRLESTRMVVLPGIVNAHDHLDQAIYRGCLDDGPMLDRCLAMARLLTYDRARAAAAQTLLELVHYGVTTTHESHWTHYYPDSTDAVCDAIRESGLRAVVSRAMNDLEHSPQSRDFSEQVEDVLQDLNRLERKYDSDHIQVTSEAILPTRCTPEAIRAVHGWAVAHGKKWQCHLAQPAPNDLDHTFRILGMGPVEYLEHLGVLGPELVAVHCTALAEGEVQLMGGCGVSMAHCPITVMRVGEMVPPIWDMEVAGTTVGLGTDGIATNNGQNPWEVMKVAIYMQRVRFGQSHLGSAEQALEMATIKAARVLDMDESVGSLELGKEADIILLRRDQTHLVPDAMLVNNLVYSGVSNRADTVIVGGRVVMEDGHSTVVDEEEVRARVREAQATLLAEAGLAGEINLAPSWPVLAPSRPV